VPAGPQAVTSTLAPRRDCWNSTSSARPPGPTAKSKRVWPGLAAAPARYSSLLESTTVAPSPERNQGTPAGGARARASSGRATCFQPALASSGR